MYLKKILKYVFCSMLFLMSYEFVFAQKSETEKKPIVKTKSIPKNKIVETTPVVKSKKELKDSKKSADKSSIKTIANKTTKETKKVKKEIVITEKLPIKNKEFKSPKKEIKVSAKSKAPNKGMQKVKGETTENLLVSNEINDSSIDKSKNGKVLTGIASFYSAKFEGRKTANGEIFSNKKFTAACNKLPLGTWLKITNLSNNKTVIVKTNDRLHPRMTRLVDLTYAAAQKLDFVNKGLTKVKAEIIKRK